MSIESVLETFMILLVAIPASLGAVAAVWLVAAYGIARMRDAWNEDFLGKVRVVWHVLLLVTATILTVLKLT